MGIDHDIPAAVVLVHGLYMNGWDMALFRRRLKAAGFIPYQFVYRSMMHSPAENAVYLNDFIKTIRAPTLHFIGHSLGGIVLRHLFHRYPQNRPGRIVTLGTPHLGNEVARRMMRSPRWQSFLGKSIEQGLLGDVPPWDNPHELGSVAGYRSAGMGRLFVHFDEPNDGTVMVSETRLPNAKDYIALPVNHSGMIFSARVVAQTVTFLKTGTFEH